MPAILAESIGYDARFIRSKSWDEFAQGGASKMDIVITVCDNAAGESCPVYGRNLVRVHWGVPDPVAVNGSDSDVRRAYTSAFLTLRKRIELMLALPVENLDLAALQSKLQEIADVGVP